MTKEEVRALRQRLGLTQEAFAQQLGVSWSTVAKWETGRLHPGPRSRRDLQRAAQQATRSA